MTKYVLSTNTQNCVYADWHSAQGNNTPKIKMSVKVNGGAGVAMRQTGHSRRCVLTEVTDEQADFLAKSSAFKRHESRGYVKMMKTRPADLSKYGGDMNENAKSRQMTPADLPKIKKTAKVE